MAYDLLRSAKHIRGLSNAEFRVLFYLLEAANADTHQCFPSMKKIAAFTDMQERTVQRHISALADRGLFERVEQRRADGSRMVNCYRFKASGTIKIGRESVIALGPEEETDGEQQPAKIGRLNNPPFSTPPPVENDTTPRQSGRDIYQESEPGIGTSSPSPNGEGPRAEDGDLFGEVSPPAEPPLAEFIEERWKVLKTNHPAIAGIRKIDDGLRHTLELRARQHARDGESAISVWSEVLDNIATSRFLQGRAPPGPGREEPFTLSLGWASKASNFREIISGRYNRDRDPTLFDPATGRRLGPTDAAVGGSIARLRAAREQGGRGRDRGGNHARLG